ncbi:MAG: Crp/Fnr family transcriptional regulator [Methylococcus sp.]
MADTSVWDRYFPDFARSDDPAVNRLMEQARQVELPADTTLFRPGASCGNYLLVLQGSVRVYIITPNGREVLLYRVTSGNPCILTTSCLMGANDYPAYGMTETPVMALSVPADIFHRTLMQSDFFRAHVFSGFAERLSHVIGRMEELVEGDIDRMLARMLLSASAEGVVRQTHQSLAIAIGSAREVVSRHLKRFETQGWVKLRRNQIDLTDLASLQRAAGLSHPE